MLCSLFGYILLLIYGGLGVGVLGLGSWIGFLGLGISVDGVLGPVVWGLLDLLGWSSLLKE